MWYHQGTAAFGSLVIAIIKTIRAVLAYIQRKAKKTGNKILEYIMCCCQCFMWCLEKCMKFLNKYAYILTAIYSYSFCKAARRAFFLLLRNILRVAAVSLVGGFILFLGKVRQYDFIPFCIELISDFSKQIFIPLGTTFLCYLAVAYTVESSEVSGIVAVLVFTFFLSYWIAGMFIEIFGMTIDTILFCYIADEEMFDIEKRYAPGSLAESITKTAQTAAKWKAAKEGATLVHVQPAENNTVRISIIFSIALEYFIKLNIQ